MEFAIVAGVVVVVGIVGVIAVLTLDGRSPNESEASESTSSTLVPPAPGTPGPSTLASGASDHDVDDHHMASPMPTPTAGTVGHDPGHGPGDVAPPGTWPFRADSTAPHGRPTDTGNAPLPPDTERGLPPPPPPL